MSYLIIILFLVNHNPAIFSVPSGIEKRHKSAQGRLQAQIILMLCQNITILSKTYLLKLSDRETGAASLCLFSSLYCWVWIHIGSNSAIRMYWMSVCPCSCVFGADFEQTCIAQIFVSNLLCFMHQLILNFTTSIRVSMPFFVILEKILPLIAVYERYIKKTFSESNQICGQDKTTQLNFILIVNIYACGKCFIQSSTLAK